jgi:hypothetical protein
MTIKQKKDHKNKGTEGGFNWKTKTYRVKHSLGPEDIKKSKKYKNFFKEHIYDEDNEEDNRR